MEYKISIENFKSILRTEFELRNGLNILIGPNGAGKSCTLNSLKFLKDILQKGVGLAMARAGGASRVFHRGKKTIKFVIELNYGQKTYERKKYDSVCKWAIVIEQKGSEKITTITKESLIVQIVPHDKPKILFSYTANRVNSLRPKLTYKIDPSAGKDLFDIQKRENYSYSKDALFESIGDSLRRSGEFNGFKKVGEKSILTFISGFDSSFMKLFRFLTSITEYNIIPERARQATEQLPFARMNSNGFGISEVIEALEKKNFHRLEVGEFIEDEGFFRYGFYPRHLYYSYHRNFSDKIIVEKALDNINRELAAAVRPIAKVSVEIDKTNGKRFVVFKSEKEKFYPDEVSDGTIKWLCILTSIYVSLTYIYLLEEPENFLHPWMQQKLIKIMRDQSEKNDAIYVLTTHSTTLLNSAFPSEVLTVQQKNKGTVVERISNETDIQNFLNHSDFRLGDLWVSGGIGAIPQ